MKAPRENWQTVARNPSVRIYIFVYVFIRCCVCLYVLNVCVFVCDRVQFSILFQITPATARALASTLCLIKNIQSYNNYTYIIFIYLYI